MAEISDFVLLQCSNKWYVLLTSKTEAKQVYSIGPVTGYVMSKSKCFKTVDPS